MFPWPGIEKIINDAKKYLALKSRSISTEYFIRIRKGIFIHDKIIMKWNKANIVREIKPHLVLKR